MLQTCRALPPELCNFHSWGSLGSWAASSSTLPGVGPLHTQFQPPASQTFLGLQHQLGEWSHGGLCGYRLVLIQAFREETPAGSSHSSAQQASLPAWVSEGD